MNRWGFCLLFGGLTALVACTSPAQIQNGWENEYLGTAKGMPFYPDNYANYWVFTIDPDRYPHLGYKITGQLPEARYMSLNLYLHQTRQSIGSLTDNEISDRQNQYEVWVMPKNAKVNHSSALHFSLDQGRHSVFLRYYDPADPYGKVALPRIEAFDTRSGGRVELPHLRFNILSARLLPRIITQFIALKSGGKAFRNKDRQLLMSYKHSGKGFFPNHDNQYLIVPIEKQADEVGILRFQPPGFAQSRQDTSADVRYWSLAFGTLDTQNPFTLLDRMAQVDADGFVYVLIGDELKTRDSTTYNHMPWLVAGSKAVLLYRNLLTHPDFPYAIETCPAHNLEQPELSEAREVLGDFAPQGKVISRSQFEREGFRSLR
jgi:hypothetical protein